MDGLEAVSPEFYCVRQAAGALNRGRDNLRARQGLSLVERGGASAGPRQRASTQRTSVSATPSACRPPAIRYLSPDSVADLVPVWEGEWVEVADGAVIGRAPRQRPRIDEWEASNRGPQRAGGAPSRLERGESRNVPVIWRKMVCEAVNEGNELVMESVAASQVAAKLWKNGASKSSSRQTSPMRQPRPTSQHPRRPGTGKNIPQRPERQQEAARHPAGGHLEPPGTTWRQRPEPLETAGDDAPAGPKVAIAAPSQLRRRPALSSLAWKYLEALGALGGLWKPTCMLPLALVCLALQLMRYHHSRRMQYHLRSQSYSAMQPSRPAPPRL